jgi:hypothetical protein
VFVLKLPTFSWLFAFAEHTQMKLMKDPKCHLKTALAGFPPHTASGAPPSVVLSHGVIASVGDAATVKLRRAVVDIGWLLVKPQPYSAATCMHSAEMVADKEIINVVKGLM